MPNMPSLATPRLEIRPFRLDDLEAIHRILDQDLDFGKKDPASRRRWLEWSVLNYKELEDLGQPPLGDRGVALRESGELIGAVGLAPALGPFNQLPAFGGSPPGAGFTLEIGLYWAIASAHQGRGYATEAGATLVRYAFDQLSLARIVATTEDENLASQGVMRKLGMRIERNPHPEPFWFQVVGILEREESANFR